ncbi:UNVERIFIED_CONTAM: hypothetical protein LK11_07065 [Mumia flava]
MYLNRSSILGVERHVADVATLRRPALLKIVHRLQIRPCSAFANLKIVHKVHVGKQGGILVDPCLEYEYQLLKSRPVCRAAIPVRKQLSKKSL